MKHNFDTYRLYSNEKNFTYSVRVRVRMKDEVDIGIMRHAANVAIKRYPYFAVKVVLGEAGGYDFVPNNNDIVEGHLLFEITSMADKIFVSFMQLIKTSKYVNALGKVLDELGIAYKIEGLFEKNIVKHKLPE